MINSPWGPSQFVGKIARGVVWVSTAGHGGLGVAKGAARKLLSDAALLCANYYNGYYWFEEDCQCTVAFHEHPEWAARFNGTADSYKASVDRHYPQYAEYLVTNKKAPKEPVVGQKLKVVRQLSNNIQAGDIVTVIEVKTSSIVFTHTSSNNLFRAPMAHVLGSGYNSNKYFVEVDIENES
jgi:hypothetical protein